MKTAYKAYQRLARRSLKDCKKVNDYYVNCLRIATLKKDYNLVKEIKHQLVLTREIRDELRTPNLFKSNG